jgi:hypothetical protein
MKKTPKNSIACIVVKNIKQNQDYGNMKGNVKV